MLKPILVVALMVAGPTLAQDAAPKAEPREAAPSAPALKAGDPAPALHIARWVKGEPVTGFERGRVYVIDFWATWCGPCIQSMPHLSDLQRQYKEGVTVIGVTSADRNNTLEKVEKMVAEKGGTMGFTVAWDQERRTNDGYLKAAGINTIPTTFVVDGRGRVAYIGHPMWLDKPLKEIVAGTWDAENGMAAVKEAESRLLSIFASAPGDPAAALRDWESFEADYPAAAAVFEDTRYALLVRAKDPRAEALGKKLIEEATRTKNFGKIMVIAGSMEPAEALATVEQFQEANPGTGAPFLDQFRFTLLLKKGDPRASTLGARLVEEAIEEGGAAGASRLNEIAWAIVDPRAEVPKGDLELAMRAVAKAVELSEGEDAATLDTLARVHAWKGEYPKALEVQKKALEVVKDERVRAQIEPALKEYEEKARK